MKLIITGKQELWRTIHKIFAKWKDIAFSRTAILGKDENHLKKQMLMPTGTSIMPNPPPPSDWGLSLIVASSVNGTLITQGI